MRCSPWGSASPWCHSGGGFLSTPGPFPTSCPRFSLSPVRSTNGAEMIGTVGSSITFHLQSLEGGAAAWSFHNEVIVTVRFGDPPEATFFDDSFKPRLAFPGNGSALSISRLRLEDAGTYTAKSAGVKTTFTLHVYGRNLSPLILCFMLGAKQGF